VHPLTTVSILCYHSHRFQGAEYSNNDHIALGADLRLIRDLGRPILPALDIVEALCGQRPWEGVAGAVAITFDDGLCLDYRGHSHKTLGNLPSFLEQLNRFDACATSFVIASPDARLVLESVSLGGEPMLGDDWWQPAMADGRIAIGNHSWDHNHASLPWRGPGISEMGSFRHVDNESAADWEIKQSQRYIQACLSTASPELFAFPNGEWTDYLVHDYLPSRAGLLRLKGAFATGGQYVSRDTPRWCIPRFVCGKHWRSPDELKTILTTSA
jgi:peptidoglycan/xylan/chitin deacetylase (PgdA/CDA1 family)